MEIVYKKLIKESTIYETRYLNSFFSKYKKQPFTKHRILQKNIATVQNLIIVLQTQNNQQVSVECTVNPKFYGT